MAGSGCGTKDSNGPIEARVMATKLDVKDLNLNERDLQIVKAFGLGLSRKGVGEHLGMDVKTLEWHLNNSGNARSLYAKLSASSDAEIVRYAVEQGMVKKGEKVKEKEPPKVEAFEVKGLETLEEAILRGATAAASGKADAVQMHSLINASDAYIRLLRFKRELN
jgi:DNA-binding CsgD family transcriptional regulator